ncbi:ATP-binding protein, partial [Arthrospira platensis SPKY1]|nr:ATP-binding protein [Arthrospira platensis SPKY1]
LSATVSDEGPGLDASILPKLFEEYVQMPLQKPQLNRGIGLGLAIVRENTRLLGGTIEATANAPRGLRFYLSLPRMQPTRRQGF